MNQQIARRGFLAIAAVAGARVLGGCGGPDVSIRIRRVDGSNIGGVTTVRASVVFTNHKNEARTIPVRLTLRDAAGATLESSEEMLTIRPAELICYCYNIPLRSASLPAGSSLLVAYGPETATAQLSAIGAAPLPSCDFTCNF